ncbi:pilin [Ignatzschineria sp. RMDPL8A]|uniref:pilin n=1 Tax=Ignatzschineria sp. RMDPL8A TaxID=2999236 RepID=UPI002446724B|nr:pilin [Ignatzschineria sp. RMDPL8A]MDG9729902.1 pilin [Ignatzschineria sp. RMDPL8A]
MKNLQKGFTLIELMIVVAIIGILAMFALPAYQDYTKRTHVAEGLSLAASAKSAVTEYYASNGVWVKAVDGGEEDLNKVAGLESATSIKGNAVDSVAIGGTDTVTGGEGNTITITYNEKVGKVDGGKDSDNKPLTVGATVILKAKDAGGSVIWACDKGTAGGTVDAKYRPANCRTAPANWADKP